MQQNRRSIKGLEYLSEAVNHASRLRRALNPGLKRVADNDETLEALSFFFLKSLRSSRAVKVLWKERLYQDGFVIARSVFEANLQSLYILIDPTATRATDFARQRQLIEQQITRAATGGPSEFTERPWYGSSLRQLAKKLEKDYPGLELSYDFLYGTASAFAHSKPRAVRDYVAYLSGRPTHAYLNSCPQYLTLVPVLCGKWLLGTGFSVGKRVFMKDKDPRLAMRVHRMMIFSRHLQDVIDNWW